MHSAKWAAAAVLAVGLAGYGLYNCIFCYDKAGPFSGRGEAGGGKPEIVVRLPSWPMQGIDRSVWRPELVIIQGTTSEGLFGYDPGLDIVPKVAKSAVPSPDNMRWTVHLRTDKKWSNGDPVTARDYVYGWTQFLAPDAPSETWASIFPHVDKALEYKAGGVPIDSVGFRALDDSTLELRLIRPKSLPSFLAMASSMPIHRKSYEAAKAAGEADFWYMPEWFVGNGPYIQKKFVRDGELELVRNPHYAGPCGNVDRFVLKMTNMSQQNVQIQQFEAGELDLAQVLTLGDYAYATKAEHLKAQVHQTPEIGFLGLQMARTVNKLMTDDKLRRAIALAVDREDIAKNVMGGRVSPTYVFGPPSDPLYQGLKEQRRDLDEARRLVKESSYQGEVIWLFTPPATDVSGLALVSESIQSQLKAIGLNVVIENMEQDLLTGVLASYVWGGGYVDDPRYTRPGLTLFPGKMLWKEPIMLLRAADHAWLWTNYEYELKELRKRITLERINIRNERKGDKPEHWRELLPLRDSALAWYRHVRASEPDSFYRLKVAENDPAAQFDRLHASVTASTPPDSAVMKWQNAKDQLLDNHFNLLTYLRNPRNWEGNRIFANIETMTLEDPRIADYSRRFVQLTIDQNWIIPMVSENLVYLKRGFIKGESMYKFGIWNMVFNLQYIEVDEKAYLEVASR